MARIPLTNVEVNRILSAAPKIIKEDVQWHLDSNQSWAKCELNVENKLKANLKLYLNWNSEEQSLFSFALILNSAYRIAGLCFNGSHKNKHTDRNVWKAETHKHRWTERCKDSWAYDPKDIVSKEIEEVFKAFCKECNIEFRGKFSQLPPEQMKLFKER